MERLGNLLSDIVIISLIAAPVGEVMTAIFLGIRGNFFLNSYEKSPSALSFSFNLSKAK